MSSRSSLAPDPCARLRAVHAAIAAAAAAAHRAAADVRLIAVSKTQGEAEVEALLGCGQRRFGENRVQEAQAKFAPLKQRWPDLALHLIGPLQTNKAADAVALFDRIDSLDRPKLADALERAADRHGTLPRLLVQVNVGREPQKAGIDPIDADRFIADCRRRFPSRLDGVMAIPPAGVPPEPFFAAAAAIAAHHGLATLSMGMSADFAAAIARGATEVRVGSALFGARA